ncbi:VanZ family protein [Erysipelotrichaceae bacterium HCN-30851]
MKKNNMGIRILCAFIFLGLCGSIMYAIYSLSAEDGIQSNIRSEIVTEKIKNEVQSKLENTEEGMQLSERIQYFVIMHSPYGSDWNANIRKLAHFSIYFVLASGVYITLWILGVNKFLRFILTVGVCFCFAFGDEYHQSYTGRTSSMSDVYLDTFGALVSTCIWTIISMFFSGIRALVNLAYKDNKQSL